jgi:hypothetical protein
MLGQDAGSFYIPAPEDKLSFLKGVDKTLGPFLPQG